MQHYHICSPYLLFTVPWACILVINKCTLKTGISVVWGKMIQWKSHSWTLLKISTVSKAPSHSFWPYHAAIQQQESYLSVSSDWRVLSWAVPEQTSTVGLNVQTHKGKTALLHQLLKQKWRNALLIWVFIISI